LKHYGVWLALFGEWVSLARRTSTFGGLRFAVCGSLQNRSMQQGIYMPVCYFSKKCRFCQAFFEELSASPYVKEIKFLCVDPSPGRPPLPAWLKSVPALVVDGEDTPRVGPAAVNNWLAERRSISNSKVRGEGPVPQKSNKLPEPISANTPASSKQSPPVLMGSDSAGIEAWHGAEMSGSAWSDEYSFLDDAFTSEKGYNPIVRNWESLAGPTTTRSHGNNGNSSGATSNSSRVSNAPPKSAKEEKLLAEFEQFSKMRDTEFSPVKRI
jgi:hypothetical protein